MKLLITAVTVALTLCGCDVRQQRWETDQHLRRAIFRDCLARIPPGPTRTQYNDWAEVVSECDNIAKYQAKVCVEDCELPSNAPEQHTEAPNA